MFCSGPELWSVCWDSRARSGETLYLCLSVCHIISKDLKLRLGIVLRMSPVFPGCFKQPILHIQAYSINQIHCPFKETLFLSSLNANILFLILYTWFNRSKNPWRTLFPHSVMLITYCFFPSVSLFALSSARSSSEPVREHQERTV